MALTGTIPAALRADRMRQQMENKNLLEGLGYIYVGTNVTETIAGGTVRQTKALAPGGAGLPLVSNGSGADLSYQKLSLSAINNFLFANSSATNVGTSTSTSLHGLTYTLSRITQSGKDGLLLTSSGSNITVGNNETLSISGSGYINFNNNNQNTCIKSSTTAAHILIKGSNTSTGGIFLGVDSTGAKIYYDGTNISFNKTLSCGAITANGNWSTSGTMQASSFNASSDRRLKTNITDYNYHDSILDIPVHEFDYKSNNVHTIGFIAQELQEKYPELVVEDANGYLAISETKLSYLLLLEIKKLKEEIEQLKHKEE